MCEPISLTTALMAAGTAASVGGTLYSGIANSQAAKAQAAAADESARITQQLGVVEDRRTRERMRGEMARQRAQLVARGVHLDSPTAIALGADAARELSFTSQSARSGTSARVADVSASARAARARGSMALLQGGFSAAGSLLTAAPKLWPGLADVTLFSGGAAS